MFSDPDFIKFAMYFGPFIFCLAVVIAAVVAIYVGLLNIHDDSALFYFVVGAAIASYGMFFSLSAFLFVPDSVQAIVINLIPVFGELFLRFYAVSVAFSFISCITTSLVNIYSNNKLVGISVFTIVLGMLAYPVLFTEILYVLSFF